MSFQPKNLAEASPAAEASAFANLVSLEDVKVAAETEEKRKAAAARALAVAAINSRVSRPSVSTMLTTTPPPLDHVIPGLVAGTVGALVSPGGTGKSFLALQLAMLVAAGVDTLGLMGAWGWQNFKMKTGKVLYLSLEDGALPIATRFHAVRMSYEDRDAIRLSQAQIDALDAGLEMVDATGNVVNLLADPEWGAWFEDQCSSHRLVIIDTLRLSHTGNENDSGEMAELMARLSAWAARGGAAILFLHHTNKDALREGALDSQAAARGSSVLIDNARGAFFLQRMTRDECAKLVAHDDGQGGMFVGEEDRRFFVKFGISKANSCAPWPDIWMRVRKGGRLQVVFVDDKPTAGAFGKKTNK